MIRCLIVNIFCAQYSNIVYFNFVDFLCFDPFKNIIF